jgi:hypothetical protein
MRLFGDSCILTLTMIALLTACSATHSSVTSIPPVSAHNDSSSTSGSRINTWTPQTRAGQWHYLIRDSSTVSINNDTASRVEPIESMMIYTMELADSNNVIVVTGHSDSVIISSRLSNKPASNTSGTVFHGLVSKQGHFMAVREIAPSSCTGSSTQDPSRIAELLVALPNYPLNVGAKWSDTSSTTTCHGKIPLQQTAVRNYELLDMTSCQDGAVKIQRLVVDIFTGSSTESNNHLSATGSGTATSILCLERTTGMLLEGSGHAELQLTVTTTRGVFPFTQRTTTHIEAR